MVWNLVFGVGGVILVLAGGAVQAKPKGKWQLFAGAAVSALGSVVVVRFLIRPFIPGMVMGYVLLGGIAVGIFLVVFAGIRQARRLRDQEAEARPREQTPAPGSPDE
jgi:drug/metabolite transporter (DMT)-like permease